MSKYNKGLTALFVGLIAVASFSIRYFTFSRSDYAVGEDAYFHIIQAESLIDIGELHAPDSSFTPHFLAAFYYLTGDWEQAQKVYLSFLCAVYAVLAYFLGKALFKNTERREALALGFALVMIASPTLTFVAAEHAKQLLGLVAFLGYLNVLAQWNNDAPPKTKWIRIGALIALTVVNFFAHRIYGVLALAGFVAFLDKKWIFAGAVIGIVFLVLGSFILPGIISIYDLERFSGILSPRFSFHPVSVFRALNWNVGWFAEMFAFYGLGIVLIIGVVRDLKTKSEPLPLLLTLLYLIAVFPFYDYSTLDMGFRIFTAVLPLTWLILPLLFRQWKWKPHRLMWIQFGAAIALIPFAFTVYRPQSDPDYSRYDTVIANTESALARFGADPEIIIMHHGLCFYYTHLTGRDTLAYLPEWEFDPNEIYRIAYGISEAEMRYFGAGFAYPLFYDYYLVTETQWQILSSNAVTNIELSNRIYSAKNPHEIRPAYLLRNK